MRVVVIEDEPLARKELICQLNEFHDIEIVGECNDVVSAKHAISQYLPDAIFLDIGLPRGADGFTLLDYMESNGYSPHVVIVSGGSSDLAVRAFGEGVLDYLAKPIKDNRLIKAIERIRNQLLTSEGTPLETDLKCKIGKSIKFVKVKDVEFIQSAPSGVRVICPNDDYAIDLTLKTLLEITKLQRCDRQYLIALSAVSEYKRIENGLGEVTTHSGKKVPVSRIYRPAIELAFGI